MVDEKAQMQVSNVRGDSLQRIQINRSPANQDAVRNSNN